MITGAVEKNLRLIFQPAESAGVNDPGAVPLVLRAIGVGRFRILATAGVSRFLRKRSEGLSLGLLHLLPRFPVTFGRRRSAFSHTFRSSKSFAGWSGPAGRSYR